MDNTVVFANDRIKIRSKSLASKIMLSIGKILFCFVRLKVIFDPLIKFIIFTLCGEPSVWFKF